MIPKKSSILYKPVAEELNISDDITDLSITSTK